MNYSRIVLFMSFTIFLFSLLFVYQLSSFDDGLLHVTVCDVGQGDAIHIRTPKGYDILIDGGPDKKVLDCLSRHMPFWDRTIEAMYLTHPHSDHFGGLIEVFKRYRVTYYGTVAAKNPNLLWQKLQAQLAEEGLTANSAKIGDRIAESSYFELQTVWPTREFGISEAKADPNDHSMVNILSFGEFKMLLTGDAEEHILSRLNLEDVDVLKVPHQGSKGGVTKELLLKIKPQLSIISVGRNKYGHPSKEIVDLLIGGGSKVLRTDESGDVEIISNGLDWSYKTQ